MSHGLRTGFNVWGANLVAIALLVVAVFLTTTFSFSGAHAWASGAKGYRAHGEAGDFAAGAGAVARVAG